MRYSRKMQKLIERMAKDRNVDLSQPETHFRVESGGFMDLVVENVGLNQISVAHYYEQNGDLCQDPEVVFLVGCDGEWYAVHQQSPEIGFCLYDPAEEWQPDVPVEELETAKKEEDRIRLPSGTFTATELNATLLLVLDQFEEFMLYHGDAVAPGEVAWELTRAMTDSELPARVLLGMREDSLAMLDRFKGRVPRLFSNYLRLEHLDFASARAAITGPLNEWNLRHPDEVWAVDDELVDAVIEDVAVQLALVGGDERLVSI